MSNTSPPSDDALVQLFEDQPLRAYEEGAAADLLLRRNRNLGNILLAERAVFYVNILYRLLMFRRDYELEPLYEDIFLAVRPAQQAGEETAEYDHDHFRADLAQLTEWGLVTCRIEVERLRGYRDTRRRKFRYRLTRECLHFLEWLEEAAQTENERTEQDARDVLEEISVSLGELTRLLARMNAERTEVDDCRRILYRLDRLNALTTEVTMRLGDFNALLLSFVSHQYTIQEAHHVLSGLEDFVEHFLRHIHELRGLILDKIEPLRRDNAAAKISLAIVRLEEERQRSPHLLRRTGEFRRPELIPEKLWTFFREDGKIDGLTRRIHDSSIKVWRKLHAHLRELERRNTRIEDIRQRLVELAALPEDAPPLAFMRELLAPAVYVADPNYWDDYEKADPPRPRRRTRVEREPPNAPLRPKSRGSGPVISLEQARLERLSAWVADVLGRITEPEGRRLSQGDFTKAEDFQRIMELSKAGLLGNGRRLRRVGYGMTPDPARPARVELDEQALAFAELHVGRLSPDKEREKQEESENES